MTGAIDPRSWTPFLTGQCHIRYDWRTKDEPLLWIADAISGAVSEHLTGKDDDAFTQIHSLVTPDYLA